MYAKNTSARRRSRSSPTRSDPSARGSAWFCPTSGMGLIVLYCIIPFYWMIVSSLRHPHRRAEHRVHPEPGVARELQGRVLGTEQLRPLTDQLGHRGRHHDDPRPGVRHHRSVRARSVEVQGQGTVLWLIMACSMFPLVVLLPPLLKMFSSTSPFTWFPYWINTYQSVILPGLSFGLPLAVWTLTAFFKQLPVELEQAAMVDGCTPGWPSAR